MHPPHEIDLTLLVRHFGLFTLDMNKRRFIEWELRIKQRNLINLSIELDCMRLHE